MKMNFKSLVCFAVAATATLFVACEGKSEDPIDPSTTDTTTTVTPDADTDTDTTPSQQIIDLGDGSAAYEIKGEMTLTYPNIYNLKGFVYVTDGASLTIEPGVIIKGDKDTKGTLIIERGGKLYANGTKDLPIVMTSSQVVGSRNPGDWGGLIILGNATNNGGDMTIEGGVRSNHGGYNDEDSSGEISYLRVEFAGIEYSTDNEINGITLGSVGSGTSFHHIQVSYSGDDSYEWFGGTVNSTNLVSLSAWDDDFDTDNGFSGKMQFLFSLRNPQYADKSASNGFESDNNSSGSLITPTTSAVFANVTMVGPVVDPTNYTDQGNELGSTAGFFQNSVQIRRYSHLSLFNSVLAGYPIGLNVDNDKSSDTQGVMLAGTSKVAYNVMGGMIKNFQDSATNKVDLGADDKGEVVESIWNMYSNEVPYSTIADLGFIGDPQALTAPVAIPSASSPLAGGADWTDALVSSGFEKVSYRGAFSTEESEDDNWMTGWTNFDPQNTEY